MTATQRCQAALDAQNAINQLWDGSDEKRKQWEEATRLIDLLYETGKNDEDEEFNNSVLDNWDDKVTKDIERDHALNKIEAEAYWRTNL